MEEVVRLETQLAKNGKVSTMTLVETIDHKKARNQVTIDMWLKIVHETILQLGERSEIVLQNLESVILG